MTPGPLDREAPFLTGCPLQGKDTFPGPLVGACPCLPPPECDVRCPLWATSFCSPCESPRKDQSPKLLSAITLRWGTPWLSRSGQNLKYKTSESALPERKGNSGAGHYPGSPRAPGRCQSRRQALGSDRPGVAAAPALTSCVTLDTPALLCAFVATPVKSLLGFCEGGWERSTPGAEPGPALRKCSAHISF